MGDEITRKCSLYAIDAMKNLCISANNDISTTLTSDQQKTLLNNVEIT